MPEDPKRGDLVDGFRSGVCALTSMALAMFAFAALLSVVFEVGSDPVVELVKWHRFFGAVLLAFLSYGIWRTYVSKD